MNGLYRSRSVSLDLNFLYISAGLKCWQWERNKIRLAVTRWERAGQRFARESVIIALQTPCCHSPRFLLSLDTYKFICLFISSLRSPTPTWDEDDLHLSHQIIRIFFIADAGRSLSLSLSVALLETHYPLALATH